MSTTVLLLALVLQTAAAPKSALEVSAIAIQPCSESSSVRTTWFSERHATVRTTTNGEAMPAYPTHEERRIDRSLAVLQCRAGVPIRLSVRYGDAFEKRLDQDVARPDADHPLETRAYTTERSPLAGRSFELVQSGESALVYVAQDSLATPSLAGLVTETESVQGGAVPLPGDAVARALGANPRTKGTAFAFDASVAQALLAGDEHAECAATATFLGNERTPEGRTISRYDLRIRLHEEPEGGLVRDVDLHGFLLCDPRSGRPLRFEVSGSERKLGAAGDARNSTEIEVEGTWKVQRAWDWRD
jgi:hypothetical protein